MNVMEIDMDKKWHCKHKDILGPDTKILGIRNLLKIM